MKTDLIVLSRTQVSFFTCPYPWACISIASPGDGFPKICKVQCLDLINLEFADNENEEYEESMLFTEDHAKEIWRFVDKYWGKVSYLVVHCRAGVARSPAVAAAIAGVKLAEGNQSYFWKYQPNQLVYDTMMKVYNSGSWQS